VPAKLSVLRACHRVVRPEGRIAYYTIFAPPDLSAADHRRIMKFWPPAGTRRRAPSEMLESAGFIDVRETDVTKQYQKTSRAWGEGRRRRYDALAQAMGEDTLKGKIVEGEAILGLIKDGLLRRSLLTARRA
jgi:cyclopropane fatty-acyl-phospholipid synthase-like methyltransferase